MLAKIAPAFAVDRDGNGTVDLDDIFAGGSRADSYSLEKIARQVEARRTAAAQAAEELAIRR